MGLTGRALEPLSMALPVLAPVARPLRIGDLRKPRIQPKQGIAQLTGNPLFAHGIAPAWSLRNLLDLAGYPLQSPMNVGDIRAEMRGARLRRFAEIRKARLAKRGIEPVVEGQPGAAGGGLGPLADRWVDAVNAQR